MDVPPSEAHTYTFLKKMQPFEMNVTHIRSFQVSIMVCNCDGKHNYPSKGVEGEPLRGEKRGRMALIVFC